MTDRIAGTMTQVHINVANVIRLATGKNSKNETTRLVNAPIKEMTVGVGTTTTNEMIGINAEMMGKENAVVIETTARLHTTTGIAPSVQIQISVSVKTATNVMPPAPVVEGNQNPETMDNETVGINKTTHTMTGIVQNVRIQISVSVKIATNVMPPGQALQVTVDKGQILDATVQTIGVEEVLEEIMEAEEVNVQTIEVEEALEETIEAKAANVRIREAENQIHNTVKQGGKVRIMHIIDPQMK